MASQPVVLSETPRFSEDSSQHAFQMLWNGALQRYELETGKDLLAFPFANNLLAPSLRPDSVVQYFKEQNQTFKTFRSSGEKIMRVLRPIVHLVQLFIDAGAEGAAASNVVPGGKTIFVAIGALLKAANGVSELYDVIESLLKRVNACLERVKTYLELPTPLHPALMDVLLRTFVQVFVVFGIVTKYCHQATDSDSKPRGKKGMRAFLRRMKDLFCGILGHSDLLIAVNTNTIARKAQPQVEFLYDTAVVADLRSWLSPLNPEPTNYEKKRRTGSCEWFFDDRFNDWRARAKGVFWVYGNAGAGKSILCSSVIDKLQADTTPRLFYFYFDSGDATKRDCLGLMSTLAFQIGTSRPECFGYLRRQRADMRKERLLDDRSTFESLFAILSQLLHISGPVYLVLDALDECHEYAQHNGLLDFLGQICALKEDNLRLFVTSRPEPDIRRTMDGKLATHRLSFHNDAHHEDDLRQHIQARISDNIFDKWSNTVKETAQQDLLKKANGM
ncbi:hypothetical protein PENSPDRAFT_358335 [Peniophora sp. CONT]|nr:hypothetical protein PENSPDRAFT_358335 [Peniophora sp. CONT]